MTDSENEIKAQIIKYLEVGYPKDIIPEILAFEKLIELWSTKGMSFCTYKDIQFVIKLVSFLDKNSFDVTLVKHSSREIPSLVSDIVNYLQNTEIDEAAIRIYDQQDVKNSLTLLTNLLKDFQPKLGNQLASDIFNKKIYSLYNDSDYLREEGTKNIYRDLIMLRYMEGYSTDVIKDTLIFKVCLMEWSEKGWSLIKERDIDAFYSEMREEGSQFIPALTPRNNKDAEILTDALIKSLENLEFNELEEFDLNSLNKKNAASIFVSIVRAYKNKIGGKLMEEIFTSLLMEMVTKTTNYNDSKNS
jgi:hypothetical protein